MLLKNSKFTTKKFLISPFICDLAKMVSDGADGTIIAKSQTNGLIKKNFGVNLLFFNNKFFILNKVFEILNF